MKLIDADKLIRKYIDTDIEKFSNSDVKIVLENLKQNILKAPSIDMVRCGECKYASDDGTYGCMCEHFNDTSDAYHRMWSDDFCSRGERNRSEKPNNCETCKFEIYWPEMCEGCCEWDSHYEPKDEPQTERSRR